MYGRGPAASADNADAIILDEVFVILSKFGGREFVNRMSAFVLGKACIRQNRNSFSRIRSQIADGIVHLRRTGGAVHSDNVQVERLKRGERGADLRAKEHRSRFLQRDLNLQRQALS